MTDTALPAVVWNTLGDSNLYRVDFTKPAGEDGTADRVPAEPGDANVVSSERRDGSGHRILVDLDVPAALVPSSTPGHSHLYIEAKATAAQLAGVLDALVEAGAVEGGYAAVSRARGYSCLRLPTVKKGETDVVCY